MTTNEQEKPRVGRPRSARAHQAILAATLQLVAEEGIQGASIEAIATRAGVGKTTIYRRWASKEALILAALREFFTEPHLIDTGNLRADLITGLKETIRLRLSDTLFEALLYRLFGEIKAHPEFLQVLYEQVFAPDLQQMSQFIARAQARGELNPNLDPLFILSLVGGSLMYHVLFSSFLPTHQPLADLPERIVDAILHGIKAHV